MGGNTETIKAKTKAELQEKVEQWIAQAKRIGFTEIRQGWDPDKVFKTDKGYEITLLAHSRGNLPTK